MGGGNLEFWAHLSQFVPEFRGALLAPQAGWDEPEAEVEEFRLWEEEDHGHSPNSQNLMGIRTSRNSVLCINCLGLEPAGFNPPGFKPQK